MSSGGDWPGRNEDCSDPAAGIVKASIQMAFGARMTEMAKETESIAAFRATADHLNGR
ncbi:hypothetical protein [Streptomyces sp. AC627_RSS907]|uniref:hypothetical protein n=1 Tax=Streptomyces sp. AC627_RSS907 TaxID=2823684 RepID=UPI0020B8D74B|nr:hypothetical protein [Streptomyces sp. AC627_RSS907]